MLLLLSVFYCVASTAFNIASHMDDTCACVYKFVVVIVVARKNVHEDSTQYLRVSTWEALCNYQFWKTYHRIKFSNIKFEGDVKYCGGKATNSKCSILYYTGCQIASADILFGIYLNGYNITHPILHTQTGHQEL